MYNILILDDVHENCLKLFESYNCKVIHLRKYTKDTILLKVGLEEIDAIVYRLFTTTIDEEILTKAKKLRCIVRTGGGHGNIDLKVAEDSNIVIMDTIRCNSFSAAEFIFASILTLARKIMVGDRLFRSGIFAREDLWGMELANKTLGIIGFGAIGKNLSNMANAFGMKVISYSLHITKDEEETYSMKGVNLDELFSTSDFISIAFPGTRDYIGWINKEKIVLMKHGVYLINATSMALFNYEDVAEALKKGKIGGIVIDRPAFNPAIEKNILMDAPNVIFSPTLGSHTHEGQTRCAEQAVNQVLEYLSKGVITNQIIR